ncbi:hypothetical protein TcBrA4_0031980 [Trypanosoma cruzi]|nr:hypothetical protein TcBrA4_0031980 [Trypanosoma cruzi]
MDLTNKYGRARPPLRLLLLGPVPGPDGIHGEALRHLVRVARRAVPWLFDSRPCAGTVPRNWRRGAVLLLPNPERTASNRDSHRPVTLSSCLSKLMERTPAARIRDVIESQLALQPSGFLPGNSTPDQLLQIRAAMHRNAPQHRTADYFVDHASAFGTVGPDAVILEMWRLSIPNRIVRWSAACLNSTSAVVCIDKFTPSSRTLTRGAPQGTVLAPIMFVVVMPVSLFLPFERALLRRRFIADDHTLIAQQSNRDAINSASKEG